MEPEKKPKSNQETQPDRLTGGSATSVGAASTRDDLQFIRALQRNVAAIDENADKLFPVTQAQLDGLHARIAEPVHVKNK